MILLHCFVVVQLCFGLSSIYVSSFELDYQCGMAGQQGQQSTSSHLSTIPSQTPDVGVFGGADSFSPVQGYIHLKYNSSGYAVPGTITATDAAGICTDAGEDAGQTESSKYSESTYFQQVSSVRQHFEWNKKQVSKSDSLIHVLTEADQIPAVIYSETQASAELSAQVSYVSVATYYTCSFIHRAYIIIT